MSLYAKNSQFNNIGLYADLLSVTTPITQFWKNRPIFSVNSFTIRIV